MGDFAGCTDEPRCHRRHNRIILTALVAALLPCLAGCTGLGEWYHNGFKVGPNYSTTAARVSDAWIDSSDPHLRVVQGDNACWWTAFGDPALDRLVAEASDQNLTLKMAGAGFWRPALKPVLPPGTSSPSSRRRRANTPETP